MNRTATMNMPTTPLALAIIGPGRIGQIYARIIQNLATVRLVAVCGHRAESTAAMADAYQVPGYANGAYAEMLAAHPEIDAVIVSASEWAHREPVLAALAAGKAVLVEKPMAIAEADAVAMVQQAQQSGACLMVCHTLRFDLRFAAMRQAVANGEIGDVLHLYARRNAPQIAVERVLGRFPLAYWLAPHDIDMMLWTTNSPVTKVMAYSRAGGKAREDFIIAVLTFANGAIGVLESSWGTPAVTGRLQTELFTVRGTAGAAEVLGQENGVAVYRAGNPPQYPDTSYAPLLHDEQDGSFRRLFHHFVAVLREGRTPVVTGRDGLAAIRVATAINRSLTEGREIVLTEE
ncbi:MAG: Gfo/Idh/MocA family oxidoreductase [Caldilineaceae bacterium]|nr:Gfo/Idh/MocA family oxidoreductase [Caldilineaceae bacterium]